MYDLIFQSGLEVADCFNVGTIGLIGSKWTPNLVLLFGVIILGGAFGVLLATVGMDFTTAVDRFTFGFWELSEGIHFIPVMIGLFAGSEFLTQAGNLDRKMVRAAIDAVKLPSWIDFRGTLSTVARSCGIGAFIGLLPAEGGTVAAMIGYNEAKRWSKEPEQFGKGAIEGIAGPEAANNAATTKPETPTGR